MFDRNSDFHNINTRNKNKLVVPKFRLTETNKSFLANGVRFYNKLPKTVTDLTSQKFIGSETMLTIEMCGLNYPLRLWLLW